MITSVDTNVLLDVFNADATFGRTSLQALRLCADAGLLVVCEVVVAEVSAAFPTSAKAADALNRLRIEFVELDEAAALDAGQAWRRYRARGGKRQRVTSGFLIAAHAALHADQLLTRDKALGRLGITQLRILDPTTAR